MQALPNQLTTQLKACIGNWADTATLPPPVYNDQGVFAIEQQVVFRAGWVGLGRSDRWSQAGDYSAIELAGVGLVVLRDNSGRLRAYANTCSHRGAQLLEGEGSCRRIRCPFHFWTYALDGALVGAPSMGRTADFSFADHGLTEFSLAEHAGFAFVSFEAEPPSIDDWIGDFDDLHAPWPIESLFTGRRREFTVECNWKSFAEVFNEYYHLPYVHPDSIDDTYNEPKDPEQVRGAYATHFGTTQGTGGLLAEDVDRVLPLIGGLDGENALGVRYSWIFPNIMIATGTEAMWMYEVYPDGPDRCKCAQVVCFPRSTLERPDFEEKAAFYYDRFDVAIAEDIPMLERQHRGLSSPFAKQGRFSYLEPSVARFAAWYAERLLSN